LAVPERPAPFFIVVPDVEGVVGAVAHTPGAAYFFVGHDIYG
jgi:hypothetical protein